MPEVFVGRQPIFDRKLKVIGYELLYRNLDCDHAEFDDGDRATSQVILNTFSEISPEKILGTKKAFINLTRNFILDKYPIPFPPHQMVLEVPENISIDEELIDALRTLARRGYQIALDDVTSPEEVNSILDIAHIVKLDMLAISPDELEKSLKYIRRYNVKILAEKVETQDNFQLYQRLGFDYFQGYFFCKPQTIKGQRIKPAHMTILRLMSRLQDPNIEFRELEEIVAQDLSLGYKILRLVNSAHYGISTKIHSIRQAMTILGLNQLQGWLTLFLMSETENKPRGLTTLAMIRAQFCELLAVTSKERHPEKFFLVGLLSVLDALLDLPMEQALALLNLSDEVLGALLHYDGHLGNALHCVLAYENGNLSEVKLQKLSLNIISDLYLKAISVASAIENVFMN
jgi:EAL and modified HD-GYP domain-containing signal transduction protein